MKAPLRVVAAVLLLVGGSTSASAAAPHGAAAPVDEAAGYGSERVPAGVRFRSFGATALELRLAGAKACGRALSGAEAASRAHEDGVTTAWTLAVDGARRSRGRPRAVLPAVDGRPDRGRAADGPRGARAGPHRRAVRSPRRGAGDLTRARARPAGRGEMTTPSPQNVRASTSCTRRGGPPA